MGEKVIKDLLNKIIEKLHAATGLTTIAWHYGEPIKWIRPDMGEGYVSLAPLEQQTVEPLMRGDRHNMVITVGLAYQNIDEKVCDQWIHDKVELVWAVLKANENWDGLVSESHLSAYFFVPGQLANYTFDKLVSVLSVRKEVYPS